MRGGGCQAGGRDSGSSGFLSEPEAIEFPTEGGRTAYAFLYPPANPENRAPVGERPPLLGWVGFALVLAALAAVATEGRSNRLFEPSRPSA